MNCNILTHRSSITALVRCFDRGHAKTFALYTAGFSKSKFRAIALSRSRLNGRCSAAAAIVCSTTGTDGDVCVQLKVAGMVCDGCSGRVLEALKAAPGVKEVTVDLEKGLAMLKIEAAKADVPVETAKLCALVTDLGFEAEPLNV